MLQVNTGKKTFQRSCLVKGLLVLLNVLHPRFWCSNSQLHYNTHTHTLTHLQMPLHTHTHTLPLKLRHLHTHTHTLSHTHIHTKTHSHTDTHSYIQLLERRHLRMFWLGNWTEPSTQKQGMEYSKHLTRFLTQEKLTLKMHQH